jgi:hypothetical protein
MESSYVANTLPNFILFYFFRKEKKPKKNAPKKGRKKKNKENLENKTCKKEIEFNPSYLANESRQSRRVGGITHAIYHCCWFSYKFGDYSFQFFM